MKNVQVPICLYPYACFLDSKTGETASKRRKGAKNSETAAKVALMKLKMHAAGDKSLPQVGFRYLGNKKVPDAIGAPFVCFPFISNSKTWTQYVSFQILQHISLHK